MDIYLTDLETGDRMRFPMLPEKISVQTGAVFQSHAILAVGDVKLPTGEELGGFSWDGILPGEARRREPYVAEWRSPKAIQRLWNMYREKKKKLRLLITETPVNTDVYLESYTVDYKHGYGDYYYKIEFVQAKDLKVQVSATAVSMLAAVTRPEPPAVKTYTVVKGDSLWAIAQKMMGDGNKYPQLYEANRDMIDARNKGTGNPKYTIYPGQIFSIPA